MLKNNQLEGARSRVSGYCSGMCMHFTLDHHWIKIKAGINYINQAGFYFVSRQTVFHLSVSNGWNSQKF